MNHEPTQTSSATSSTRCFPRVAVTGFYAHYFKSFRDANQRVQFFSSLGHATLRDAFACHDFACHDFVDNDFVGDEDAFEKTPQLDHDQEARRVARELRNGGLWDSDLRVLTVDNSRVGVAFSASKNQFAPYRVLDVANLGVTNLGVAHNGVASHGDFAHSSDAISRVVAQKIGARGPRLSPVAACATGAHAIALGAQLIQDGYADVMICGAWEPVLSPLVLAAYRNMNALSKSGVMRPFDIARDGFLPNVGAGCVILENAEHAHNRGATIYAFLDGWAMNNDATHMTAMCPSGDSIARAIEYSMHRVNVQSVDYINAHGTATKLNDETEARGIVSVLGKQIPVSSTKPLTGHLLGAAGAAEAVISILALRENFIPPTLNLQHQDAECAIDCVPNVGRDRVLEQVLNLNYGFGGHVGALLFSEN